MTIKTRIAELERHASPVGKLPTLAESLLAARSRARPPADEALSPIIAAARARVEGAIHAQTAH